MTDSTSTPAFPRPRRRLLVGVMGLAVAVALLLLARSRWQRAAPPDVDPTSMEPAVGRAVQRARAQVLQRPRSPATWGVLGQVFLANEMEEEGRLSFIEAERLDPTDPRWPYYQGGVFLNRGEREQAAGFFRKAAALRRADDETGAAARLRLAETLAPLDATDEVEASIREVLDARPDDLHAHFALASLYLQRQQWEEGRTHLLRCLNSPHARQKARIQLAALSERLGRQPDAERFRAEAERMPPDTQWPDPWVAEYLQFAEKKRNRFRLAENLETAGRFAEAADVLRPMTETFPDDYLPFLTLGKVLAQAGDLEGAEQAMRRALKLAPNVIQAHYYMSLILVRRGEVLAQKGERDQARDFFEQAHEQASKALQKKPDYGYALMADGLALKSLGRNAEALRSLRAAVACNPEYSDLHLHLADMQAAGGLREEAQRSLEESQRIAAPGDPRPAKALERLKAGKLPILELAQP